MKKFEIGRITHLGRCNNYMTVNSRKNRHNNDNNNDKGNNRAESTTTTKNNNKMINNKNKNGDWSVATAGPPLRRTRLQGSTETLSESRCGSASTTQINVIYGVKVEGLDLFFRGNGAS